MINMIIYKSVFIRSQYNYERKKIANSVIKLVKGDVAKQKTDALVNAANSQLSPGGVAGAIHQAAGSNLWEECKTLNGYHILIKIILLHN